MSDFPVKKLYKCITFLFLLALVATGNTFAQNSNASERGNDHGRMAIDKLGDRLPAVALRHGKTPDELRRLFIEDPTLFVDDNDRLLYVDEAPNVQNFTQDALADPEAGPFPYTQTFQLHSRPGSNRVIYLDFNGHVTSNSAWNSRYTSGQPINSTPFSLDNDPTTFSQQEQDVIQYVWQRVAEDYAPFDVDVTTQDPGDAAILRSSSADLQYGTRVVISPTNFTGQGIGGIAYVGVFNYVGATYQPAFVMTSTSSSDKFIAEATSHEVGHNLNLNHDGTSTVGYYEGHGDWSPIMGVGYYTNISQWSKGEYPGANELQDDLAVMQAYGTSLIADDHGNTTGTATVLSGTSGSGLITTRTDVDVFRFTVASSGIVPININPAPRGGNLDIKAEILDSAGNVIATSDPSSISSASTFPSGISASFNQSLSAGTYYLRIDGTGVGTLTTGYSDYGSLGQYSITIGGTPPTCSPSAISFGPTVNGTLSSSCVNASGQNYKSYTFSGTQGQQIAIEMNASFDTYLELFNGTTFVTSNDDSGGSLNSRIPANSGYLTLPATATYTIVARGYANNATGDFTLRLTTTCTGTISFEQTLTGTLSSSCVNASGQNYKSYTFSGTQGQQIAIEMNASFDTYLELFNGTTFVTSNDDSGGSLNSRIPANSGYLTLPATATYTIVARGYANNATGDFTLRLTGNTIPPRGLQYYPLAYPIRLLDTRSGQPACYAPGQSFGYGTIRTQPAAQVTCQSLTIPSTAEAIVGTVSALNTPAEGNLRLYPAGEPLAEVSNVNFIPGRTVSNSFTVKLGTGGAFNIYSFSPSDVIIDVTGYYAPPVTGGLYYHQLPNPIRILETRPGEAGFQTPGAPLAANSVRLQQAGNISYLGVTIPASARAITGNATVVNNGFASNGKVKLYPGDITQVPVTENINYVANQTIPNAFTVRLDNDGRFNINTTAQTHVLIDVTGYYSTESAADQNGSAGLLFNILPRPFRLLDTRAGETACDAPGAMLSGQSIRVQTVRGRQCGGQTVPSTARAIYGNATVVNNFAGAGFGNIRLYPGEQPLANASNLNYASGDVIPNSFIVGLGVTNGAMNIYSFSSTHFIVDVSGYFAP